MFVLRALLFTPAVAIRSPTVPAMLGTDVESEDVVISKHTFFSPDEEYEIEGGIKTSVSKELYNNGYFSIDHGDYKRQLDGVGIQDAPAAWVKAGVLGIHNKAKSTFTKVGDSVLKAFRSRSYYDREFELQLIETGHRKLRWEGDGPTGDQWQGSGVLVVQQLTALREELQEANLPFVFGPKDAFGKTLPENFFGRFGFPDEEHYRIMMRDLARHAAKDAKFKDMLLRTGERRIRCAVGKNEDSVYGVPKSLGDEQLRQPAGWEEDPTGYCLEKIRFNLRGRDKNPTKIPAEGNLGMDKKFSMLTETAGYIETSVLELYRSNVDSLVRKKTRSLWSAASEQVPNARALYHEALYKAYKNRAKNDREFVNDLVNTGDSFLAYGADKEHETDARIFQNVDRFVGDDILTVYARSEPDVWEGENLGGLVLQEVRNFVNEKLKVFFQFGPEHEFGYEKEYDEFSVGRGDSLTKAKSVGGFIDDMKVHFAKLSDEGLAKWTPEEESKQLLRAYRALCSTDKYFYQALEQSLPSFLEIPRIPLYTKDPFICADLKDGTVEAQKVLCVGNVIRSVRRSCRSEARRVAFGLSDDGTQHRAEVGDHGIMEFWDLFYNHDDVDLEELKEVLGENYGESSAVTSKVAA